MQTADAIAAINLVSCFPFGEIMDSLKSETQEFRSSHGWWSTCGCGYNFMDREDELTKNQKFTNQFYGGERSQIFFKHMKTSDNCLTACK